jgi:hypothetical protein
MMRKLLIAPVIVAALLAWHGSASVAAGQAQAAQQPGQHDQHTQKPDMASCQAMMAQHQKMMDEMKAMDARLDGMVQKMNAAQGQAKTDATAATVTELVQQRKTMHERMMAMHQGMMSHMMGHMAEGKESMAACPMMKMMHK